MMLSTAFATFCGLFSAYGATYHPLTNADCVVGIEAGRDKSIVILTSADQMNQFSSNLLDLAVDRKAYTDVLNHDDVAYELRYPNMAIGEWEMFNFRHTYAISVAHLGLGTECTVASVAKNHYENIIRLVKNYENHFAELNCNPGTRGKIDLHLMHLYSFAGQAHSGLYQLYNISSDTREETKESILSAIRYYEKLISSVKTNIELQQMPTVHQTKANLINAYFSAYQMYFDLGHPINMDKCAKRMQALYKQLRGTESFGRGKNAMDAFELFSASKKTTPKGGILAKYRNIRAAESNQELVEKSTPTGTMVKFEDRVNHRFLQIHAAIELDLRKVTLNVKKGRIDLSHDSFPSIGQIFELENEILSEQKESSSFVPPIAHMTSIYRRYIDIIGFERAREAIKAYLSLFLCAGDLDNALLRTKAFESILAERSETSNIPMHYIMACIKSLNGDHHDLLVLQEKAQEIKTAKAAQKAAQQEEKHTEKVSEIKQVQQNLQEKILTEEERKAKEKAKRKAKEARQKERRKQAANASAPESTNTPDDADFVSTAQAKNEKLARHIANEQLRAERKAEEETAAQQALAASKMPATTLDSGTQPPLDAGYQTDNVFSAEEKQHHENELSDFLQNTYDLKGVALQVNESIRHNTWDFTRDQLKAYYEAMGCVSKSGKGSHNKVQLPKSLVFTQGEEVVAIISDLGGALTLPSWDDFVPDYLKKQIQCAREKLRGNRAA